jgi:hypothetical protein
MRVFRGEVKRRDAEDAEEDAEKRLGEEHRRLKWERRLGFTAEAQRSLRGAEEEKRMGDW